MGDHLKRFCKKQYFSIRKKKNISMLSQGKKIPVEPIKFGAFELWGICSKASCVSKSEM